MLMGELRRNQAVSHPVCHLPQSLVNDSESWKYKFHLILLPSSFLSLNGTSVRARLIQCVGMREERWPK